jgi:hypothetical protein
MIPVLTISRMEGRGIKEIGGQGELNYDMLDIL